jgi:hypothetical protein
MPNPVSRATRYWLELDGAGAGWLDSTAGGLATGEVVFEPPGPDHIARKHIAGVKYESITLSCGAAMSKTFYNWIKGVLAHIYTRLDGAVITVNADGKDISRIDFYNGLITEIGFPALDGSSKDACYFTVKIAPVYTRRFKPVGTGGVRPAPEQKWFAADFRLQISGLDCTHVSKVEAPVLTARMSQVPFGEVSQPAFLEIPDLVVTLDEDHADSFYDWHKSFVIDGNNGNDQEKSGTLDFLTPDRNKALFTLAFNGLGIYSLKSVPLGIGTEAVRQVQVQMYCDNTSLNLGVVGGSS